MKTDFTVIGRTRNAANIFRLVEAVKQKGYTCYNFLSEPISPETAHLSWEEQMKVLESHPDFWTDPIHQHHFEQDMAGLKNADAVILLLPAGNAAHMEAGVAHGLGKRLIIVGNIEKPETLYLMASEHYEDITSFLETL